MKITMIRTMFAWCLILLATITEMTKAFNPTRSNLGNKNLPNVCPKNIWNQRSTSVVQNGVAPIMGIPFIGRFRKKKAIDIPPTIEIGSSIPSVDIEVVSVPKEEEGGGAVKNPKRKQRSISLGGGDDGSASTINDVLGSGTSILVGMPGAFTPTCSNQHLPGYINSMAELKSLGVDKVAVVTTNDKYVNKAWGTNMGLAESTLDEEQREFLTLLSDGDGELVKQLGLADDMGFGVGIRSKRFALVITDGTVTHIAVDEGMDECQSTSAEELVRYLTPDPSDDDVVELSDRDKAVVAGGAVLLLALLSGPSGTTSTSAPPPPPPPTTTTTPTVRVNPATTTTTKSPSTTGGQFNLLKDYL